MRASLLLGLSLFGLACSSSSGGSGAGDGGAFGGSSGSGGSAAGGAGGASSGGTQAGGTSSGGSSGTLNLDGGGTGGAGAAPNLTTPVDVLITSDNAYGFGYGDGAAMANYFGGVENTSASEIFDCPVGHGPEQYTVPADSANAGAYLYVIGWADHSTTQGILAKFSRGGAEPVFTGNGEWEVCATGQDFDVGSGGPSLAVVNAQIAACNAGTGDVSSSSGGWVSATSTVGGAVAFGEDNTTPRTNVTPGNEFPIVCEIDGSARWMWYDWDTSDGQSAFIWPGGGGNPTKDFLIFRLGAEFIPEPPP